MAQGTTKGIPIDTDATLTANSDGLVASQKAVKSYVDNSVASGSLPGLTASVSELNILDGATLTTTELNYVDGVTSAIQTQFSNKANVTHTHGTADITDLNVYTGFDTRYYTESETDTLLSGKANTIHTHAIGDVSGLQTALDAKVDENAAITGATKTKITYDAKGLVTAGADATTADIADSLNKRYVTDANLTTLSNTSGTNTGDETQSTIKTKLGAATSLVDGYLTSTDWNTFNGKQASLGYTAEDTANKENTTLDTSTIKYPTNNLVKTGLDAKANISHTHTVSQITDLTASATELNYVDGVTSAIQTQIDAKQAKLITIRSVSTAQTLALTDLGTLIELTGTTARAFTVPLEATVSLPIGFNVAFTQSGTGALSIAAEGGVTIQSPNGLICYAQYASGSLTKIATNTWVLAGNMKVS